MKQYIEQLSNTIVRVTYVIGEDSPRKSELISEHFTKKEIEQGCYIKTPASVKFLYDGRTVLEQTGEELTDQEVWKYVIDGEPQIEKKQTANGEVSYIANARKCFERYSHTGRLEFKIGKTELLLGLGQYEDGIFDYRNHREYLYESNMRIAMPILVTTGHYAILIDTESSMIFESNGRTVEFQIDTTDQLTYYVIMGDDIAHLVQQIQQLTGRAAMLPRWAFGYIQSRERYQTSEELLEVTNRFRSEQIPLDCIVQDWHSWREGMWGDKRFDLDRYPDLGALVHDLHEKNVKFMVSVWPNMSPDCEDYREFTQQDLLLKNANTYDAFDEAARSLYWKQCEREIMSAGSDALWCDNAEPFSDADWSGESKRSEEERYRLVTDESRKSIAWEQLNTYGLYHAKGIYENWRRSIPGKRVVNLTRSSYLSGQQYGCITWSGDICARWETMKKQIVEGLKMGLSGNPYWTLDIGGFFVVNDKYENRGCDDREHNPLWFWKGDYNDGVQDFGYRELYTRWLQFGTFLPIFRSHGTDTPREPWNFGREGDSFYDTIVKFIRLRYHFMPYIYSCAAAAHRDAYIMMRSLAFDFSEDQRAVLRTDEYMFGSAFLTAPVLHAMYYEAGSKVITGEDYCRPVYLPAGVKWYDYWTGQIYEGGQEIQYQSPIEITPLFIRAGAIIPVSDRLSYADERKGQIDEILIYEGADGTFTLYNDEGDGYGYETGWFWSATMTYLDVQKVLCIGDVSGDMEPQHQLKVTLIQSTGSRESVIIEYSGDKEIYDLPRY